MSIALISRSLHSKAALEENCMKTTVQMIKCTKIIKKGYSELAL